MNPPVTPDAQTGGEGETLLARRMIITSGVAALAAVGAAAASSAAFGPSIETASSDGLGAPIKPGGSSVPNTPVPTTPKPTPSGTATTAPPTNRTPGTANPPATSDPRSPATANPPADRDQSYANPGAGSGTAPRADAPAAAKPVTKPAPPKGPTKPEVISTGVANNDQTHSHLLARATFGPRASDFADLSASGIDSWLGAQLAPASISDPDGDAAWVAFTASGRVSVPMCSTTATFPAATTSATCLARSS